MALTRPAGVALQLLALGVGFGGCVMTNGSLRPGGDGSLSGIFVMLIAAALFVVGGAPARRKAKG